MLLAFYEATGDVRFSDAIAAMDQHGIEKGEKRGAPRKWRRHHLVRLWAQVQAIVYDQNQKSVAAACRSLVKGKFGYGDKVTVKIKNHRSLNRVYDMAAKLVSCDPQVAKEADKQKRQCIFERHPDNKEMGAQVERDRIEEVRALTKSLKELGHKPTREK
jgi:hypothetical protein